MKSVILNTLVVLILIAIIAAIVLYIFRQKKRGVTCIGCLYAKQCGGNCGCHGSDGERR